MGKRRADAILQSLSRLAEAQASPLGDGQLLHRFASDGDERAFAALLQRHGRRVCAVCRNILKYLLPHLIPGATYQVSAEDNGWYKRVAFTAPAAGSSGPAVVPIDPRPDPSRR